MTLQSFFVKLQSTCLLSSIVSAADEVAASLSYQTVNDKLSGQDDWQRKKVYACVFVALSMSEEAWAQGPI